MLGFPSTSGPSTHTAEPVVSRGIFSAIHRLEKQQKLIDEMLRQAHEH